MPNESGSVDQFLNEINKGDTEVKEAPDPFKVENDPFKSATTEVKEGETPKEEVRDEKPVPFHKDPKVTKYIEKEIEKRLASIKPSSSERTVKEAANETTNELVEAFKAIIGNDTPEKIHALKMLEKGIQDIGSKASQEAISKIEAQQRAEIEAEEQAQSELEQGFENIEETFGVDISSNTAQAKKMRNEFVEYVKKIAPKNSEGEIVAYPDLPAAFEEFQERSKRITPTNSRAKELASRSMVRSNEASVPTKTADQSWNAVDKIFSKIPNR